MIKKTTFSLILFSIISLSSFAQVVWEGNTNTDWNTASNWNGGLVPVAGEVAEISINTNSPIISGTVPNVARVDIKNDGLLTIASGGSITSTSEILIYDTAGLVIDDGGSLTVKLALQCFKKNIGDNTTITNKGTLTVGYQDTNTPPNIYGIFNVFGTFTQTGTGNTLVGNVIGVNGGKFLLEAGKVTVYSKQPFDKDYSFYATLGSTVNIKVGTTIECLNSVGESFFSNQGTITNDGTISLSNNVTIDNRVGGILNTTNASVITAYNIANYGSIDVNGATVTVANSMSNGNRVDAEYTIGNYTNSSSATLKMHNNSTLSVNSFVNYHNSTVDSDNLTFTVATSLSNDGTYDMDGGTLDIGELFQGGFNGEFNLNSGTITVYNHSNNLSFWFGTQTDIVDPTPPLPPYPPTTLNVSEGGYVKFLSTTGVVANQSIVNLKGKMDIAGPLKNYGNNTYSKTDAIFTIKSDENGTGSLKTEGTVENVLADPAPAPGTGTMTVERWIDKNKTWQLVTSPMSAEVSNAFLGHYLNEYNEASGDFKAIKSTTHRIYVTEGLVAKLDGNLPVNALNPIEFKLGKINSGDLPKVLTVYTGTDSESNTYFSLPKGFNLVGNPYPSPINWKMLYSRNSGSVDAAYYSYVDDGSSDGRSDGWKAHLATDNTTDKDSIINIGQGFGVVLTDNNPGNLHFSNAIRTHNKGTGFSKKSTVISKSFNLVASSSGMSDNVNFRFNENSTIEFDSKYDAYKFNPFGDTPTPSFISADGKKLAICQQPESESVDLGFNMAVSGEVTFSLSNVQDFTEIVLEDKETGDFVNLLKNKYTFTYSDEDAETGRFTLHFKKGTLSEIEELDNLSIYSNTSTLYLKSDKRLDNVNISIYNVSGQEVLSKQFDSFSNKEINTDLKGIYILKLSSDNGNYTTKLILN